MIAGIEKQVRSHGAFLEKAFLAKQSQFARCQGFLNGKPNVPPFTHEETAALVEEFRAFRQKQFLVICKVICVQDRSTGPRWCDILEDILPKLVPVDLFVVDIQSGPVFDPIVFTREKLKNTYKALREFYNMRLREIDPYICGLWEKVGVNDAIIEVEAMS